MGVNSLPKTVTWQRRGCDLNPGPTVPESSTLTTRLPSHPGGMVALTYIFYRGFDLPGVSGSKRVKKFEAKFHVCNSLQCNVTLGLLIVNNGVWNLACIASCSNNNLFTLVNIWLRLFVRCLIIIFNYLLGQYFFCFSIFLVVCVHVFFYLYRYLPTVILTIIWYSITHPLFHSRLKTFSRKSFPPQPFLSFSSSWFTTWIPQTVYCYFWAYLFSTF